MFLLEIIASISTEPECHTSRPTAEQRPPSTRASTRRPSGLIIAMTKVITAPTNPGNQLARKEFPSIRPRNNRHSARIPSSQETQHISVLTAAIDIFNIVLTLLPVLCGSNKRSPERERQTDDPAHRAGSVSASGSPRRLAPGCRSWPSSRTRI